MKILHTSDWHLGRGFKGESLLDDQAVLLDQVLEVLATHDPDALIIAGDIFDRAAPPAAVVRQFSDFMRHAYHETGAAIILIAGNHDSGERIGLNETLADPSRVLIRGPLEAEERVLILTDEHGPVAFSALPYAEILAARACFGNETIAVPADVLAAEIAAARRQVPMGTRWVIAAHAFVAGAQTSESERALAVGGIETVPHTVFDGAQYVALGHLHRPQSAGANHIRYSGAPMAFGFDEVGSEKSMTLVQLGADGVDDIELIPFRPHRAVREVRGVLADLEAAALANPSDDFFKIVLTDEGGLIDPMGRIRKGYPNAMAIERENRPQIAGDGRAEASLSKPADVVAEFLTYVRGSSPSEAEAGLVTDALGAIETEET